MTRPAKINRAPSPVMSSPFGLGGTAPMPALDDLSDVDMTGVTDGQVPVWDDGTDTWLPGTAGGSGSYPASPITIRYAFDTTTTDSDPGAGNVRLSDATQYLAVTLRADLTDADGADVTALLDAIANWLSTTKGYVRLQHETDATKWLVGTVSAIASPSGYRNITIANIAKSANSPFANADAVIVSFVPGTLAHAASHLSGATDAIKLDDLAAPDDNTDLNASTSAHGLLQKLPGGTTTFYRADGTFAAPPGGGGGVAADGYTSFAGSGGATIPGLRGSGDVLPSSPHASDDEFETLSGWSTLGTVDVSNVSDVPSHWHGTRTIAATQDMNGIYKASPSMPFTVVAHLRGAVGATYNVGLPATGIMLLDSTPTKLWTLGLAYGSGFGAWNDMNYSSWTNRTTRATNVDVNIGIGLRPDLYMKMVVTSSANVSGYLSFDGFIWWPIFASLNSGLTVANVGLFVGGYTIGITCDCLWDWIRFS